MAGVPHPQGPEYGFIYSSPAEARASAEEPAMIIPMKDFLECLERPETQAFLARTHRLTESNIEFVKEVAPGVLAVDHHLARRAGMYAIDGGKE